MKSLNLTHQTDALTLLKLFGHKQKIGFVLLHPRQGFIGGGHRRQNPGPDRYRQGESVAHADDVRGPIELVVHLLQQAVLGAEMGVEIQDDGGLWIGGYP